MGVEVGAVTGGEPLVPDGLRSSGDEDEGAGGGVVQWQGESDHGGAVGDTWLRGGVRVGVPHAQEAADVAGCLPAGGEVSADAVQAVLEVGLRQQGVGRRAGGLVDEDHAGGVVDDAEQGPAGFHTRAPHSGTAAGFGAHFGQCGGGDAYVIAGGLVRGEGVVGPGQPAWPGGLGAGRAGGHADDEGGHDVPVGGVGQGVEDAGHQLSGQCGDVGGRAGEGGVRAAGFGLEELRTGLGGEEVVDQIVEGVRGVGVRGQRGAAQDVGAAAGGTVGREGGDAAGGVVADHQRGQVRPGGGVSAAGAFEVGTDDAVGGAVPDQVEGVQVEFGQPGGDVADERFDTGGVGVDPVETVGQDASPWRRPMSASV